MDSVEMSAIIWKSVTRYISIKLCVSIALKHVIDLNVLVQIVPLLCLTHYLDGLIRRFMV